MLHPDTCTYPHIIRITLWWWMYLWIPQILMQLTSQPQDFRIWQHFNSNWTTSHLQKLTHVPEVPVAQLYKHMIDTSEWVHSFTFNKDDDEDPSLIWTILMYPGTYMGTIGMIFAVCIGVYCFKRFWFRPATPKHRPYSPVSLWHAIVDDDVEAAPIYRSRGTVDRTQKTLQESWPAHWMRGYKARESCCKQLSLLKGVPITRSLAPKPKILGKCNKCTWLIVRLRIWPVHDSYFLIEEQWICNSPLIPQHWIGHLNRWSTSKRHMLWSKLQHVAHDILQRGHASMTALNHQSIHHEQSLTHTVALIFLFKDKYLPHSHSQCLL